MVSSPSRNPAFFLIALFALGTTLAAQHHDPVKTRVVERIEARYVSDRTACLALQGAPRKECETWADLRQKVAISEFQKLLSNEGGDPPPDNLALGAGPSPS